MIQNLVSKTRKNAGKLFYFPKTISFSKESPKKINLWKREKEAKAKLPKPRPFKNSYYFDWIWLLHAFVCARFHHRLSVHVLKCVEILIAVERGIFLLKPSGEKRKGDFGENVLWLKEFFLRHKKHKQRIIITVSGTNTSHRFQFSLSLASSPTAFIFPFHDSERERRKNPKSLWDASHVCTWWESFSGTMSQMWTRLLARRCECRKKCLRPRHFFPIWK